MKKNVKRSSDKFALDEFITVFFADKIGQKKNRMREDLRHILCAFIGWEICFKMEIYQLASVIGVLVELMLNSSRFFRKHAQIRDSFVVFLSHRLKILVQLRTHYARTVKRISFQYRNIWVFK